MNKLYFIIHNLDVEHLTAITDYRTRVRSYLKFKWSMCELESLDGSVECKASDLLRNIISEQFVISLYYFYEQRNGFELV